MSNYEFWDELGKIFNAVVAYQEKSVEFNKRFINPWIRLGNVFDKQDRNREAIAAYQKAIEIDPDNAQNWCDLGNAYFRTETYDQAIHAFQKAIELDPKLGWPYSNLALAYVTQDNHEQAIFLYQKSIELLQDSKDKAVSWNRLGNLYRKLNEYELAVQAFQKADELDHENAGFRDELDEIPAAASPTNLSAGESADQALEAMSSPIQLIVEQNQVEDAAQAIVDPQPVAQTCVAEEVSASVDESLPITEVENQALIEAEPSPLTQAVTLEPEEVPALDPVQAVEQIGHLPEELVAEKVLEVTEPSTAETIPQAQTEVHDIETQAAEAVEENSDLAAEAVMESPDPQSVSEAVSASEIVEPAPVSVQEVVETFTESIIAMDTATETTNVSLVDETHVEAEPLHAEESLPVAVVVEAAQAAQETPTAEVAAVEPLADLIVNPEPPAEEQPQAETVVAVEQPAEMPASEPSEIVASEIVAPENPAEPATESVSEVEASEVQLEPVAEKTPEELAQAVLTEPISGAASESAPVEAAAEPISGAASESAPVEAAAEPISGAASESAPVEAAVEPLAAEASESAPVEAAVEPIARAASELAPVEVATESVTEQPLEIVAADGALVETQSELVTEQSGEDSEIPQNAAYEEFLKDDGEALNVLTVSPQEEPAQSENAATPVEPITKLDASGELQIEMDTKNAHVWNELGNVYFNNGAVDDSVIAYSKAIELDRWFAWPYSNLALAYVQKGRYPEAVLLYQRSIELFSGEKDKAISWNRLGNVYRRLNDYEHAIEAYQRADELDPDNTTLSLQSRFSLLGSYQMEQNASYAA